MICVIQKTTEDKLSPKAREDLRQVLNKEIGPEHTAKLDDDGLDHIGYFLLTIMALGIKMRARETNQKVSMKPSKKL